MAWTPVTNAVRTLLLGISGSTQVDPTYPGEEFVDPKYNAPTLPAQLQFVRQLLFGTASDRAYINYRLRELMTCIHSCELAEFVYSVDPRVTYWPLRDVGLFNLLNLGVTVVQLSGTTQSCSVISGPIVASTTMYYQWRLTVLSATNGILETLTYPYASQQVTFNNNNGLITVPLPNSNLAAVFNYVNPAEYLLSGIAPPVQTLPSVIAGIDNMMNSTMAAALFGVTPVEPYLTFSNLWFTQHVLPYRAGALALALAYQTKSLLGG